MKIQWGLTFSSWDRRWAWEFVREFLTQKRTSQARSFVVAHFCQLGITRWFFTLPTCRAEQRLCNSQASVRLSVLLIHSSSGGWWVCCWATCRQEISTSSCGHRAAGAGAQQQMLAASCWELMEEAQHRLLDTHTHTHPFIGPFSRTTRVSRYQKVNTNLDFTEARDSEWQWHQLDHMQVCTALQTDNHTSTPPLSFLQAGCPSCRPTNSVNALKARLLDTYKFI